jgi:methionyl-tRNA synthetase
MASGGKKILVAPAWPYASGFRHLGHAAAYVPFDVFARYHRLKGNDVLAVSGTDEHGTPVMVAADAEGKSYREIADFYNQAHREDFRRLGFTYDCFTRTTTPNHARITQDLFATLYEKGAIVERTQLVSFSPATGHTLPDRYIEGTCPICGYPEARGDQCDNCGNQLDPTDLINPRSKIDGSTPEFRETNHLFLDLPAFADTLKAWIDARQGWRPNVRNFSRGLLDEVRPRPITRDLDWGVRIPVPGYAEDPNKRIYVWFDAVIGYLSASVEWARRTGDPDAWRDWWQNPEARHFYFMGKDNIVFHSVIWPGILLGYDGKGDRGGKPGELGELGLPTELVSSEFLTMEGRKFSSSRAIVIYVRDFLDRYDADALRYFIAVAGPEAQDTDFTWAEFVRRTNDELVAGWGNLVNRTISMAAKNIGSVPPQGDLTAEDETLLATVRGGFDDVGALLEKSKQKAAINEAMRVVSEVNKYISDMAPWKLKTEDPDRMATVLHVALQAVRDCNTMLTPFLPHSAQQVHELLGGTGVWSGLPEVREVSEDGNADYPVIQGDYAAAAARWESIPIEVGTPLRAPTVIFRKLDPSVVDEELARLEDKAGS